jgi:hypothetical protein
VSWHQLAFAGEGLEVGSVPVPTRNGPALWETLLEATGEDEAVVAGGCIRDYLLGLSPKDIDIFVPLGSRQEFEELIAKLNDSHIWSLELMDATEYHTQDAESIIGVAEGEALGLPVNIISRVSHLDACPWDLITSFDFGILQWSFQSTDRAVVGTTQAIMDLAGRTATLLHARDYEQSLERFTRFNGRNPGALRLVNNYVEA